jgi:hypothetical protein
MQDMRKQRRESLAQAMVASGALARVEQRVKAKFAVKKVRMKELGAALDYEYKFRGSKKRPKELQNTQRVFLIQALADIFDYDKDHAGAAGSAAGAGGAKRTPALRVTLDAEAGEEREDASVGGGASAGTDSSNNSSASDSSDNDDDSRGGAASSYSDESSDGSEERPAKRTRNPSSRKSLSVWIGRKVAKHFPGHGYFQGHAQSVHDTDHGEVLSVLYKDGDAEHYDTEMMKKGIALYKERKRQHHSHRHAAQLGAAAVVAVEEAQSV